jgi:hypothetical protein
MRHTFLDQHASWTIQKPPEGSEADLYKHKASEHNTHHTGKKRLA